MPYKYKYTEKEAVHSYGWHKGWLYREANVCVGALTSKIGLGRSHSCSGNYVSKDKQALKCRIS